MRKFILLGLYASILPLSGHSQSQPVIQSNGVVVHQAQGVEGHTQAPQEKPVQVRTIGDWNLPECMDALAHTEQKLQQAITESDRERYLNEKARIVQRINELKSAN